LDNHSFVLSTPTSVIVQHVYGTRCLRYACICVDTASFRK
jgi:hypothetical protein